jgi:hypothetical protein
MTMTFRKLVLGAVAVLIPVLSGPALAAGMFEGFASPSTTSNTLPLPQTTTCIPMDTRLSGGRSPQTVCVTPQNLAGAGSSGILLTDGATIVPDMSLGSHFVVTLGGNRTLGTPTNPADGQRLTLFVVQDATGARSLSYVGAFKFGGGTTPLFQAAGGTAGAISQINFTYRSNASAWYADSAIMNLR